MSEYWEPPAAMIEKAAKAACESHHKETAAWDRWDRNVWRQNARAALLAAFPNGPSASIEAVWELGEFSGTLSRGPLTCGGTAVNREELIAAKANEIIEACGPVGYMRGTLIAALREAYEAGEAAATEVEPCLRCGSYSHLLPGRAVGDAVNRGQSIDEIIQVLRGEGFEGTDEDEQRVAHRLLDAILPQVTTVEELEALPVGSKGVSADGTLQEKYSPRSNAMMTTAWRSTNGARHQAARSVLRHGPLMVVWQP